MDIQEKILRILESSTVDLTISDIAKQVGVDRHTASKHLDSLESKGLCKYRIVGRSKLWRINDSPLLSMLEDPQSPLAKELASLFETLTDNIIIYDKDLTVMWDNETENRVGKKCYDLHNKCEDDCVDCPISEALKQGKTVTGEVHDSNVTVSPMKKNGRTIAAIRISKKKSSSESK